MKCAPRQSVFVGNGERAAAGEQKCKKQGVTANSRKQRIICLYKNENEDKLTTEVWLEEKKKKENTRTVSRMTGKGQELKCTRYDTNRSVVRYAAAAGRNVTFRYVVRRVQQSKRGRTPLCVAMSVDIPAHVGRGAARWQPRVAGR